MADIAPIDLTALGAAVDLPPPEHPFWEGPLKSATLGFPDYNMSREQMAAKIYVLETQMARLASLLGVDLNAG